MKATIILQTTLLFSPLLVTATGNNFQRRCGRLTQTFKAPNTKVLSSEYVKKGTEIVFPNPAYSCAASQVAFVDMCRLRLNVTTSARSSTIVETWMPVGWKEAGDKRMAMVGNGGLNGCIQYSDVAYVTNLGFATVGHNNGHNGDTARYFYKNPDVLKDYVERSLITATKIGKQAINFFYETQIKHSYHTGCSLGGRQGMKLAQDYPDLYDGIVSGNPAVDFGDLGSAMGYYHLVTGKPGDARFLTQSQWTTVNEEILAQCDEIDGVKDDVIEDPFKCHFRPEALICADNQSWETHKCLTSPQVDAVRKFYEPIYGNKGRLIFPRLQPGGGGWGAYTELNGVPHPYVDEYIKYVVYSDPSWSFENFNLDTMDDLIAAVERVGLKTFNPDLSKLQKSGTKFLMYHGLTDGLITSENSYRYYESVVRNMSLPSAQLDPFFRFFPVSGLDHCAGGKGAWFVGGGYQSLIPGVEAIPADDLVLMRMVKWVEKGIAPETLYGMKLGNFGVEGDKEHCKYPLKNVYKGSGDPSSKHSWECK